MFRKLAFNAFVALLSLTVSMVQAQNLTTEGCLPRATPESVGIPSSAITKMIERLDRENNRVDSVMVLRYGKVVAEAWRHPSSAEKPHAMYSLSKSFCSTAIGFAIDEGKLTLDAKIVDFFPEDVPANASENLKKMDIESLLSMSCGHDREATRPNNAAGFYNLPTPKKVEDKTWVQAFMENPVPHEPKTHFQYNTIGTYMAGAMLEKAVGESIGDYLFPRLFEPLHIEAPYWEKSPEGVDKGGTGLYLKTEDVAKFGQFLLQKGVWNGKRLLSEDWIEKATSKQISNGTDPNSDWSQGYGFQFWRCRHNAYRGDGAYGQFCIVIPDYDAVVVLTSDASSTDKELNAIWEELLPNIQNEPLAEDSAAVAKLRSVESSLLPKEGRSGSQLYRHTIYNEALDAEMRYLVYVPNGYLTETDFYPVLYLLHGLTDDETTWSSAEKGQMKSICDKYFAEHPEQKRVIVMPDARATWYRDSYDDSDRYETFFFETFIPTVEKQYRVKADKASRAIAGLSMGGYGTLLYALHHPGMFNAAYGMSPAVMYGQRRPKQEDLKEGQDLDKMIQYSEANDVVLLLDSVQEKKAVRFTIDCGDDDFCLPGAYEFFETARMKNIPCELRIRDGVHSWNYWRVSLPLALEFISK